MQKINVRDAVLYASKILSNAGFDLDFIKEARILVSYVKNYSEEDFFLHQSDFLLPKELSILNRLLSRRSSGEPIAYLVKKKEFLSREFYINRNVLIPRPETEELVLEILKDYSKRDSRGNLKILDLGVGSGCILLSIILELENSFGWGIDISKKALFVCKENVRRFSLMERVKVFFSNWLENVEGKFDVIVANPPYISIKDINLVSRETLLYEPSIALFSEFDGLYSYIQIGSRIKKFLNCNGTLYLEVGFNQEKIINIYKEFGLFCIKQCLDLSGKVRFLKFIAC